MTHQAILVLDFGSQYTQLIARRLRELSVYSEIVPFNTPAQDIKRRAATGLILSGGPASVADRDAPHCDPAVFDLGIPVLGICYGMQEMTNALGGRVERAPEREYGHATVTVEGTGPLLASIPETLRVWASHGDFVACVPPGFDVRATSPNAPVAAMEHSDRQLHALLFHPEVAHTEHGAKIIRNFVRSICACRGDWTMASFIEEAIDRVRERVGPDGRVVCGLSGGVDSTVHGSSRTPGDRYPAYLHLRR